MSEQQASVGRRAPDFALASTQGLGSARQMRLADYQDRWLMLLFYPRDFSLVCPTELTAVSERLSEFNERECDVLAISTDSLADHERWLATAPAQGGLGPLNYPLASDLDGAICKAYGVYLPRQHVALRGLFFIDPNGVLQYQAVHNLSVGRSVDEVLRVLDAMQSGGLCPSNWTPQQPAMDVSRLLKPGHVFGPYEIEALLGSGSFGTVFKARDRTLDRTVALKVLRAESSVPAEAILAEARAAAAVTHPNLCVLYAVDSSQGAPVIVMEYVAGKPLNKLLEAGPLPAERAASLARQIATGMAAAHARGVIHSDLKPANIQVAPDGAAKVMDFGLARREAPRRKPDETADFNPDADGGISGTPAYMSPEQARGERVTSASDVFSLGLILFEMLTGKRAIPGAKLLEVLRGIEQIQAEEHANQLAEPFAGLLRLALVNDPARRNLTMAQFAERCLA